MHENARTDNAEASSLDLGNFLPGAQIAGRYTVQRVISADLCAVYAATENDTDRHIALKIIRIFLSLNQPVIIPTQSEQLATVTWYKFTTPGPAMGSFTWRWS